MSRFTWTVFAAAAALAAFGCGRKSEPSAAKANTKAQPIAEAMCFNGESFRRCYGAELAQCLDWANAAVAQCLEQIPRPESAKATAHDFGLWGVSVGHCAERAYHQAHKDRFLYNDAACAADRNERLENYKKDPTH